MREAVSLVRDEAGDDSGKWKRCDGIVTAGLDPLLDVLEGSDVVAAAYYKKMELIGTRGFGEVYHYRHKLLGRDFALRVLNPSAFASTPITLMLVDGKVCRHRRNSTQSMCSANCTSRHIPLNEE